MDFISLIFSIHISIDDEELRSKREDDRVNISAIWVWNFQLGVLLHIIFTASCAKKLDVISKVENQILNQLNLRDGVALEIAMNPTPAGRMTGNYSELWERSLPRRLPQLCSISTAMLPN